jgi:hypothetical protein
MWKRTQRRETTIQRVHELAVGQRDEEGQHRAQVDRERHAHAACLAQREERQAR